MCLVFYLKSLLSAERTINYRKIRHSIRGHKCEFVEFRRGHVVSYLNRLSWMEKHIQKLVSFQQSYFLYRRNQFFVLRNMTVSIDEKIMNLILIKHH